jgi:hypothetical protein
MSRIWGQACFNVNPEILSFAQILSKMTKNAI